MLSTLRPSHQGLLAAWHLGQVVFPVAQGQEGLQRLQMPPWQVPTPSCPTPHGLPTAHLSTHAWGGWESTVWVSPSSSLQAT